MTEKDKNWLDDLEEKNKGDSPYLSVKIGSKYRLAGVNINIDHEAKYKIKDKDYAIRITGLDGEGNDKILSLNSICGEIAVRKLGARLREQNLELDGADLDFDHPSDGCYILKSQGKLVRVMYNRDTNKFVSEEEDYKEEVPF